MAIATGARSVSMERHAIPKIMRGKFSLPLPDVLIQKGFELALYEFAVIAEGLDPTSEDFEARFYRAGCDDATVAFQRGLIIVDFSRESNLLEEAIHSAVEAVRSTGATVIRVEPEPLVSLSDIAERAGLTKAAISLYARGQRGSGFPHPVARVTTDSPLWNWADIAKWLNATGKLDQQAVAEATLIASINSDLAGLKNISLKIDRGSAIP